MSHSATRKTTTLAVRAALASSFVLGTAAVIPVATAQETTPLTIEEVLVTARKREENLQEVPMSVAVVDATAITDRNLQSINDVARFTPGLSFSKAFGRATERPVIRGLGNVLAGVQFGVESGAAYFVDGIYYPGDIQGLNLNSLDRVEVIKGPQSAMYGRNSYSGAINFVTSAPSDEFEGGIVASAAEDDEYDIRTHISGPIIPGKLGGSLYGRYYSFDGQWTNQVTRDDIGDEETQSITGSLEWTPNEKLTIRPRLTYNKDDDGTRPLYLQDGTKNNCRPGLRSLSVWPTSGSDNDNQYFCGDIGEYPIRLNDKDQVGDTIARDDVPLTGFLPGGTTFFGDPYSPTDGTAFDGVEREVVLGSLLTTYEFDNGYSLTFAGAFRDEELETGSDSDHSSVNFKFSGGTPGEPFEEGFFAISGKDDTDDYSLELRLDSPQDQAITWMVGGFYFDQQVDDYDYFFAAPDFKQGEEELENWAVFGSAHYSFTDKLSISAELRYMEEEKTLKEFDDIDGVRTETYNDNDTWDSTTPRVSLEYQFDDDIMFYASYAEGAKPGGFNGVAGQEVGKPTYDQEESDNYEIGVKSILMDGRLLANATIFYTEIDKYQLTTPLADPDGALNSIATNQGEGEVWGTEIELVYRATENITLGANYALADTEFTEGCDEFQWTLTSGGGRWTGDEATSADFTGNGDCSIEGNQFPLSSKHQASGYINFIYPLANGMELFMGADVTYEDEKPVQVHNLAYAPDATLVGARIQLSGDNWSIAAFGRNLTDEDATPMATRWLAIPYFTFSSLNVVSSVPGVDTGTPRAFFAAKRKERQFGVEVSYNF